jgi:hypothetical protein
MAPTTRPAKGSPPWRRRRVPRKFLLHGADDASPPASAAPPGTAMPGRAAQRSPLATVGPGGIQLRLGAGCDGRAVVRPFQPWLPLGARPAGGAPGGGHVDVFPPKPVDLTGAPARLMFRKLRNASALSAALAPLRASGKVALPACRNLTELQAPSPAPSRHGRGPRRRARRTRGQPSRSAAPGGPGSRGWRDPGGRRCSTPADSARPRS